MTKPIPRDFGWRYILWLAWSNALTILLTVQTIFVQLTIDSTLTRSQVHWLLSAAGILGIIVAQIKRSNPPGPPPRMRKR